MKTFWIVVRIFVRMETSISSSLSPQSSLTEPISVFQQLRDFRSKIPKDLLTQWEKPTGVRCLLWELFSNKVWSTEIKFLVLSRYIAQDWAIILLGHQLYIQQPCPTTFLLAIVLMAWGQRALSNLAHDSIHRNLVSNQVRCCMSIQILKLLTDHLGLEWHDCRRVPCASFDEHCTYSTPNAYCSPPLPRYKQGSWSWLA